jgi:CHASE3 domain sensor protein
MKVTLGKKLGSGFAVIVALMVLTAVLTYWRSTAIEQTQARVTGVLVPTINALKDLQRDLNQTQSKGRQAILAGNEAARWQNGKQAFDSAWAEIGKDIATLDELSPHWSVQENRDKLIETKQELPSLRDIQEAIMKQAANGERDTVVKAGNDYADKATAITEAIKKPLGELADSFTTLIKASTECADPVAGPHPGDHHCHGGRHRNLRGDFPQPPDFPGNAIRARAGGSHRRRRLNP